jgi:signal transduction histidine kinase
MKGSLQFILNKGKWLTGVEREMLGVCQRNTERLIRLITDILDISRIEAGKVAFSMRPVVTGDLALYALEEVKAAALVKNISVVNELGDELPPIYGDYDRLLQVFSHLVSNAVKFSPPNSIVTVSAERQGGFLAIAVADNGKVIKPSDRERLFTKFQHFGQAEGGNAGGSGLGLAISREIISKHGGNIYYSTGTAGGNVFTFTVPVYGEADGKG